MPNAAARAPSWARALGVDHAAEGGDGLQEQASARAALCASTVLGHAFTRYVLRFPARVELGREEIVDWLGPTIQRYLTAPTP